MEGQCCNIHLGKICCYLLKLIELERPMMGHQEVYLRVIVDNNTWNNTHIATVGRAMASPEEDAHKIALSLDATHILVIFGGMSNYSGDDISKFLWMVRIAAGVFPNIKENNYYSRGHYRIDR